MRPTDIAPPHTRCGCCGRPLAGQVARTFTPQGAALVYLCRDGAACVGRVKPVEAKHANA